MVKIKIVLILGGLNSEKYGLLGYRNLVGQSVVLILWWSYFWVVLLFFFFWGGGVFFGGGIISGVVYISGVALFLKWSYFWGGPISGLGLNSRVVIFPGGLISDVVLFLE